MKTHRCLTMAAALVGMALPAALWAVEGESQLSGQLTKIEGDRYTVHGDQGRM